MTKPTAPVAPTTASAGRPVIAVRPLGGSPLQGRPLAPGPLVGRPPDGTWRRSSPGASINDGFVAVGVESEGGVNGADGLVDVVGASDH